MKIDLKPLSVNRCWQGRRFKTPEYHHYEIEAGYLLPKDIVIPEGKLLLKVYFGVSSKGADTDNPVKPFVDILQKVYGFDDRRIYRIESEKVDVPKGKEFIDFSLSPHATLYSCE